MRSWERRRPGLAGIAIVLVLSAGCGGDDDVAGGDANAGQAVTDVGGNTQDTDVAGAESDLQFDCPLSAEQVGDVLGVAVEKDESTCTYVPGGNVGSVPSAGFIPQLAELCDGDFVSQSGYSEPVNGLGVDAYLKTGGGATAEIWVCAADAFLVFVDTGDSNAAGAASAAEELAKAALAAE